MVAASGLFCPEVFEIDRGGTSDGERLERVFGQHGQRERRGSAGQQNQNQCHDRTGHADPKIQRTQRQAPRQPWKKETPNDSRDRDAHAAHRAGETRRGVKIIAKPSQLVGQRGAPAVAQLYCAAPRS